MANIDNNKLCHEDYAFTVMAPYFGQGLAQTVGQATPAATVCANGMVAVHNEWCRRGKACGLDMTDDVPQGTSLLKSDANEIAFLFARSVFSEDIVQQAWQLAQSRLSCSQVSAAVKAAMIKPKFRSR